MDKYNQDQYANLARRSLGIWIQSCSDLYKETCENYFNMITDWIHKFEELKELIEKNQQNTRDKRSYLYEIYGRYKYKDLSLDNAKWKYIILLAISIDKLLIVAFDERDKNFIHIPITDKILLKKRKIDKKNRSHNNNRNNAFLSKRKFKK